MSEQTTLQHPCLDCGLHDVEVHVGTLVSQLGGLRKEADEAYGYIEKSETTHRELYLEIERVRGEMKALNTRVAVYEGLVNSQSARLHTRLDELNKANTDQQQEINTLKLHSRYIAGIAAAVIFLLTYLEKILKLFK